MLNTVILAILSIINSGLIFIFRSRRKRELIYLIGLFGALLTMYNFMESNLHEFISMESPFVLGLLGALLVSYAYLNPFSPREPKTVRINMSSEFNKEKLMKIYYYFRNKYGNSNEMIDLSKLYNQKNISDKERRYLEILKNFKDKGQKLSYLSFPSKTELFKFPLQNQRRSLVRYLFAFATIILMILVIHSALVLRSALSLLTIHTTFLAAWFLISPFDKKLNRKGLILEKKRKPKVKGSPELVKLIDKLRNL